MGQRHQIYIRIVNPLKNKKLSGEIGNEKDKKEAELYFGKGKFSIIPFHHQWLYGTTAVGMLVKILKEAKRAKGDNHPFSPELSEVPYSEERNKLRGFGLIELIQAMLSITDLEVSLIGGRFKLEHLTYIGDEHFDYEKEKVDTRMVNHQHYCNMGDNNDGVMIVDIPSMKYCFMNIDKQEKRKDGRGRSNKLPQLKPVSAMDYQLAYYPVVEKELSKFYLEQNKTPQILKEHASMAKRLEKIVGKFDVLSLAEVQAIFPRTYKAFEKEKTEANAKKLVTGIKK